MKRPIFITTAVFLTCFSGDLSVRAAGGPQVPPPPASPAVMPEEPAREAVDGEGAPAPEIPPAEKYDFHPDVQSMDDALAAELGTEDGAGAVKIIVKTPQTCREFSSYMDERQKKLDELESDIRRKQQVLEALKLEFKDLTSKYAVAETRVRSLIQRDPGDLKNNPELAKMIRLYESLPPEESAARLKNLDLDLTIALLKGMKPKKLSLIMEVLEPRLAAALSSQIVRGF